MQKKRFYILFLLPLVFAILANEGFGFGYKAGVTLSCLLIIFLNEKKRLNVWSNDWFIIIAFLFSIAGDWFLSNKRDSFIMFTTGIGLYFLAHTGYLIFALKNGNFNKPFTGLVLLVYLIFFFVVLWPAIEEPVLLVATLIYLLISCISVGASINLKTTPIVRWSYFTGIALILLSDTIISFKEFTSYQELNFLILPTYYAAHMVITLALVEKQGS